jgi:hypothetical protein
VEQLPPDLARVLLRPLAPLAGQIDPLLDLQTRSRDRGFGAGGICARCHDAERPPQPLGLARLEAVGGERLVNERPAAVAQHPAELGVRALEVGDVLEDAAAPDEVGALVLERERLGGPADEANLGSLVLRSKRIDPDDGEAEPFREAVRVRAVAAPDVDDEGALRQPEPLDELVEQLGAPRPQALVEGGQERVLDALEFVVGLLEPAVHPGSTPSR